MSKEVIYEIKVRGQLAEQWSDWFDGITIRYEYDLGESMNTLLIARLDQTALHGILLKIRNLNLHLVSVKSVEVKTDVAGNEEEL